MQIIPIPFEKEITVDDDVSELILSSGNVLDGD
ncbi:MAG: coenzyme F420-0:L-glutamate ligase, partial [Nitrosopumilus sp.]|nr:coenzyme F420-0:L-glutamate ligase [Nitrosopumilus sp.]